MLEKWRLIIDPCSPGSDNMATDEALVLAASLDSSFVPVMRIYGWAEPTVSIGYLQKAAPFLEHRVPMVRRITGGRALLHDDELTYAVVAGAGSELYASGISGCYSLISNAIVKSLKAFGVDAAFARPASPSAYRGHRACFASSARYEVMAGGKKIAGSAQRRLRGGVLQHGSIMYGINSALWGEIFGEEALRGTATIMAAGGHIERAAFQKTFVENVSMALKVSFAEAGLTEYEKKLKRMLIEQRYSRKEWNERAEGRSPHSGIEASAGAAGA